MVDAGSFLDNLENARLAMSVALEHPQENRDREKWNQRAGEAGREVNRQSPRPCRAVGKEIHHPTGLHRQGAVRRARLLRKVR